jgi:hypothetical protein
MLGAGVAVVIGLRAPFLLAAGAFFLAAALVWALVPGAAKEIGPTARKAGGA